MFTFAQKRPPTRQAGTAAKASPAPRVEPAAQTVKRQGEPLSNDARSYFEPRFGYDFSKLRIHADGEAARSASGIQARAYTLGRDIVFGAGEYSPSTTEGRRLIAHELAHVVQQQGGSAGRASAATIRRTPAKPTPHVVTQDDVVQNMSDMGGPYKDTAAWEKSMQATTFLGHDISNGVRAEFKAMLTTAETKVKAEFKKSGNTPPSGFGIKGIGGYRRGIHPHAAGVAIDIDGNDNPYILHEGVPNKSMNDDPNVVPEAEKKSKHPDPIRLLQAELQPVYNRIAQFILNTPIDGEQSVIPRLITTSDTLPKGGKASKRDRVAQYYDRLTLESDAMKRYFALMTDDAALKSFLSGEWTKLHPGEKAPSSDDVKKQMWQDYAVLGGAIPGGAPPGSPDFKLRPDGNRPFHPKDQAQRDPASGFLTIPREVVLGLGQVVPRWGAIDFGPQSGDVMHFDDKDGLGKPFLDGLAKAADISKADFAKAKAEYDDALKAEKTTPGTGSGSGSGTPPQQQGSGSAAPIPQRKVVPGAVNIGAVDDPLEHEADAIAERIMRMEQPSPASIPSLGHAYLSAPVSSDSAGTVRRARTNVQPEDVSAEMVGRTFRLRESFTDGTASAPKDEIVTVTSWDNDSSTVVVTSPSVKGPYKVPKFLLEPERTVAKGVAPYGVGLGKVETSVERGSADVAAFQKTEADFKTPKGKASFDRDLNDLHVRQAGRERVLNKRLIQATMLNRFDSSILKWVDFYNTQFGFKGKDALDPNLIKAIAYEESGMGTSVEADDGSLASLIVNRFNILQAIDTLAEEQVPIMREIMPDLIAKHHLDDVVNDWKQKENELDELRKKKSHHALSAVETTRFVELTELSAPGDNWQTFFLRSTDFTSALQEFLTATSGGKQRSEDYDFWIRAGVRAVFEKHRHHKDWLGAARAFNGGGSRAKNYRKSVGGRMQGATKAEKDKKEYVPHGPDL
ncbi:MAG: DUF4157 domain-containing protein [Rhodanobacter sp.]